MATTCRFRGALAVALSATALAGCTNPSEPDDFELLDPSVCAPDNGPFTVNVDNRFFPLPVGSELVLSGVEDGAALRIEQRVTGEVEKVGDVTTRVVEVTRLADGAIAQRSRDFYAQAPDGTVCLFGRDVDTFEGGVLVGHGGSWRADVPGNAPGIFMPGEPRTVTRFERERAPAVAVDTAAILATEVEITVPGGHFVDAVWLVEWDPLAGESSMAGVNEFYAPDVGPIADGPAKLVSDGVR
jgi:hypothetical protein